LDAVVSLAELLDEQLVVPQPSSRRGPGQVGLGALGIAVAEAGMVFIIAERVRKVVK
jgi:hypothetical protein